MSMDATIERLINSDKFENLSLALNLAIGQKSELAFSASERYTEMICQRHGGSQWSVQSLYPTDYASECSQMAKMFEMLPHECAEQFPFFVELGIDLTFSYAKDGDEIRAARSACALHEGRYWR